MSLTTTKTKIVNVGMTQSATGSDGELLTSVLGSCVGVAMIDCVRNIGGFVHIVLAESRGQAGTPGKFADTAIPALIHELVLKGADRNRLQAKIAGGSSMFSTKGSIQIGEDNITAVLEHLGTAGIPLVAKHVGGNLGRKVELDCSTGVFTVEIFGSPVVKL